MLLEIKHNTSIKMTLLTEKGFRFIPSDLLSIKVTLAKSQNQFYFASVSQKLKAKIYEFSYIITSAVKYFGWKQGKKGEG
jgi:hypothetical protein